MTRRSLRSICFVLVGVLLFAQMAIASYACPALASSMGMQMSAGTSTAVELTKPALSAEGSQAMNCEEMAGAANNSNATLCAAHCQFGQHSSDVQTITVPIAMMALLYFTLPVIDQLAVARTAAERPAVMAGAAAPPLAILHCCLRI